MKAGSGENGENRHVSVLGHFPSLDASCQASGSSVWAASTGSPQEVGSRNAVVGVLSWAHRNPGLNSLRQHLCSSKSWRPGLLSKRYQPPFLPPSSYAAVLMSSISPGGLAKEGFDADGWRMADHRRQPFTAAHRGRSSSAGRWAFRGRVACGRDSWSGRGGRAFGAGGSYAPFDRESGDSSREQEYQDVITMEAATCLVSELLEIDDHAVLNSSLPICSILPGSKSNERNDVDPVVLCHAEHSTDELNQSLVNAISDQVLYCPAPSSPLVDTIRLGMTEDKLQNQHAAGLLDEPEVVGSDRPDLTMLALDCLIHVRALVDDDGLVRSDAILHSQLGIASLDKAMRPADTQDRFIHLGLVKSFAEEALKFNSITMRVKTDKINHGEFKLSAKRTNMDEDILSKAQRMAAKRNLEISELSFIPFHSKIITSKCEKIGISLGTTENEVLQSVVSIKNIELDRLTVAAKSTSPFNANTFNNEEDNALDDELSHIAERWDEDSELCGLDRCCELTVAPRRKKANRKGKVNRPSKKPGTPSKISL
ncbi:hypothetical protein Zm00014a_024682 [Zea mays]|uniref:Uncharacterized protein n=1 Tax=Zea mays TaxID=4577 RepID=A0A3L6GD89_MAIZE|nr:hypothetical protein Zm00014a_024682 [Zea mays]